MSEFEGFINKINEDRADDNRRLVLADWLDEHGHGNRAEFIREAIALYRNEHPDGRPLTLEERERLECKHDDQHSELFQDWYPNISEALRGGSIAVTFDRGLPQGVELYESRAYSGTQNNPAQELVHSGILTSGPSTVSKLTYRPVNFGGESPIRLCDNALQILVTNGQLKGLTELVIGPTMATRHHINGEGIARLIANCQDAKDLTRLSLTNTEIGYVGVGALAGSEFLNELQSLDLTGNQLGDDGIRLIANARNFQTLSELRLDSNHLNNQTVEQLARSRWLINLKHLALNRTWIGDEGLRLLCQGDSMQNIENLELQFCGITQSGMLHLANSPYLKKLRKLDLSNNVLLGDSIYGRLVLLLRSDNMKNLEVLKLDHTDLTNEQVRSLAYSGNLSNLKELSLDIEGLGDEAVYALANSDRLSSLESLILPRISQESACFIARSTTLSAQAKVTALNTAGYTALAEVVTREASRQADPPPLQ